MRATCRARRDGPEHVQEGRLLPGRWRPQCLTFCFGPADDSDEHGAHGGHTAAAVRAAHRLLCLPAPERCPCPLPEPHTPSVSAAWRVVMEVLSREGVASSPSRPKT